MLFVSKETFNCVPSMLISIIHFRKGEFLYEWNTYKGMHLNLDTCNKFISQFSFPFSHNIYFSFDVNRIIYFIPAYRTDFIDLISYTIFPYQINNFPSFFPEKLFYKIWISYLLLESFWNIHSVCSSPISYIQKKNMKFHKIKLPCSFSFDT